jgi:radical SAM protein with 4Fe4S-binding SPASM domain
MLKPVSPEHGERLIEWVYDLAGTAPFAIKTTEAPSYRRVALSRLRSANKPEGRRNSVYQGFGIRDGHGIVFVSQKGDIFPSGFLPLKAGNVRDNSLVDVYRNSPLFRGLHNPDGFEGRCGHCEYRKICGGSRARAFACTGDPRQSDPFCTYEPAPFRGAGI